MHSSPCWNIPWAEANGIQYRKMYRCNYDDDRCHTKNWSSLSVSCLDISWILHLFALSLLLHHLFPVNTSIWSILNYFCNFDGHVLYLHSWSKGFYDTFDKTEKQLFFFKLFLQFSNKDKGVKRSGLIQVKVKDCICTLFFSAGVHDLHILRE